MKKLIISSILFVISLFSGHFLIAQEASLQIIEISEESTKIRLTVTAEYWNNETEEIYSLMVKWGNLYSNDRYLKVFNGTDGAYWNQAEKKITVEYEILHESLFDGFTNFSVEWGIGYVTELDFTSGINTNINYTDFQTNYINVFKGEPNFYYTRDFDNYHMVSFQFRYDVVEGWEYYFKYGDGDDDIVDMDNAFYHYHIYEMLNHPYTCKVYLYPKNLIFSEVFTYEEEIDMTLEFYPYISTDKSCYEPGEEIKVSIKCDSWYKSQFTYSLKEKKGEQINERNGTIANSVMVYISFQTTADDRGENIEYSVVFTLIDNSTFGNPISSPPESYSVQIRGDQEAPKPEIKPEPVLFFPNGSTTSPGEPINVYIGYSRTEKDNNFINWEHYNVQYYIDGNLDESLNNQYYFPISFNDDITKSENHTISVEMIHKYPPECTYPWRTEIKDFPITVDPVQYSDEGEVPPKGEEFFIDTGTDKCFGMQIINKEEENGDDPLNWFGDIDLNYDSENGIARFELSHNPDEIAREFDIRLFTADINSATDPEKPYKTISLTQEGITSPIMSTVPDNKIEILSNNLEMDLADYNCRSKVFASTSLLVTNAVHNSGRVWSIYKIDKQENWVYIRELEADEIRVWDNRIIQVNKTQINDNTTRFRIKVYEIYDNNKLVAIKTLTKYIDFTGDMACSVNNGILVIGLNSRVIGSEVITLTISGTDYTADENILHIDSHIGCLTVSQKYLIASNGALAKIFIRQNNTWQYHSSKMNMQSGGQYDLPRFYTWYSVLEASSLWQDYFTYGGVLYEIQKNNDKYDVNTKQTIDLVSKVKDNHLVSINYDKQEIAVYEIGGDTLKYPLISKELAGNDPDFNISNGKLFIAPSCSTIYSIVCEKVCWDPFYPETFGKKKCDCKSDYEDVKDFSGIEVYDIYKPTFSLTINDNQLAFDKIKPGEKRKAKITCSNATTASINISKIYPEVFTEDFTVEPSENIHLKPGTSQEIEVTFHPKSLGEKQASFIIEYNNNQKEYFTAQGTVELPGPEIAGCSNGEIVLQSQEEYVLCTDNSYNITNFSETVLQQQKMVPTAYEFKVSELLILRSTTNAVKLSSMGLLYTQSTPIQARAVYNLDGEEIVSEWGNACSFRFELKPSIYLQNSVNCTENCVLQKKGDLSSCILNCEKNTDNDFTECIDICQITNVRDYIAMQDYEFYKDYKWEIYDDELNLLDVISKNSLDYETPGYFLFPEDYFFQHDMKYNVKLKATLKANNEEYTSDPIGFTFLLDEQIHPEIIDGCDEIFTANAWFIANEFYTAENYIWKIQQNFGPEVIIDKNHNNSSYKGRAIDDIDIGINELLQFEENYYVDVTVEQKAVDNDGNIITNSEKSSPCQFSTAYPEACIIDANTYMPATEINVTEIPFRLLRDNVFFAERYKFIFENEGKTAEFIVDKDQSFILDWSMFQGFINNSLWFDKTYKVSISSYLEGDWRSSDISCNVVIPKLTELIGGNIFFSKLMSQIKSNTGNSAQAIINGLNTNSRISLKKANTPDFDATHFDISKTDYHHIYAKEELPLLEKQMRGNTYVTQTSYVTIGTSSDGAKKISITRGEPAAVEDQTDSLFSYMMMMTDLEPATLYDWRVELGFDSVWYDVTGWMRFMTLPEKPLDCGIIDNNDALFVSKTGSWVHENLENGYIGDDYLVCRDTTGASFSFHIQVDKTGYYNIAAQWPKIEQTGNVLAVVNHTEGTDTIYFSQKQYANDWLLLGNYVFSSESIGQISFYAQDQTNTLVFDALQVCFTRDLGIPAIISQRRINILQDVPYTITLDDLEVSDDDNAFPDDFILSIAPGDNYSTIGNTIVPDSGYFGYLSIPAFVHDGTNKSPDVNLIIEVVENKAPDFSFTNCDLPDMLFANEAFTVSAAIANIGGETQKASKVWYFLSTDTIPDNEDIILGENTIFNFSTLFDRILDNQFLLPVYTPVGELWFLAVIDDENNVEELNEDNNVFSHKITLQKARPDLYFSDATIYGADFYAGGELQLSCQVRNTISAPSEDVNVTYVLSNDTIASEDDFMLGHNHVTSISLNDSIELSSTLEIPYFVPYNSAYLLMILDRENTISETDKSNNTWHKAVYIDTSIPDIEFTSNSSDTLFLIPSTKSYVHFNLFNPSQTDIDSFEVKFYVSNDMYYDLSDNCIDTSYVYSFLASQSIETMTGVSFPYDFPSGTWYIIAKADDNEMIQEINEQNNTFAKPVHVASNADIVVHSLVCNPDTIDIEHPVQLSFTVKNEGNTNSGTGKAFIYFTRDSSLQANDLPIDTISFNNVSCQDSILIQSDLSLDYYTFPDTFFVFVYTALDTSLNVREYNVSNNSDVTTVEVVTTLPDFSVAHLQCEPQSVIEGEQTTVSFYVKNEGDAGMSDCKITYYMSQDYYWNQNLLLDSSFCSTIPAGDSLSVAFTFNTPFDITAGEWFLRIVLDEENKFFEYNEYNNSELTTVDIFSSKPDLIFTEISPGSFDIFPGAELSVETTVMNCGYSDAGTSEVSFYLSKNQKIDQFDSLLHIQTVPSLLSGETYSMNTTVNLPEVFLPDTCFVLSYIDSNDEISEADENNNLISDAVNILAPDFIITNSTISSNVALVGETVDLSCVVENLNPGRINLQPNVSYFLSKDSINSIGDYFIQTDFTSIPANESSSYSAVSIDINDRVPPGDWLLLYIADKNWQIPESNKFNNYACQSLEVRGPDLEAKKIDADNSRYKPGVDITIDCQINNPGYLPVPVENSIRFYFSHNEIIDEEDVLLVEETVPVILTGDSISLQTNFNIPVDAFIGYYNIIAVIDEENELFEQSEHNNELILQIEIISSDLSFYKPPTLLNQVIPQSGFVQNGMQIINNGPGDNDITSDVSIYLSSDDEIDATDVFIDTEHIGPLLAGEISTITSAFSIPDTCQMGMWSVIYVLDEINAIDEMDEDNNTALSGFTISASDLTIESSVIDAHVQAGEVFTVNTEIANIGDFNSKSVVGLSYYLSGDTVFDDLDTYLLSNEVETVTGGANIHVNQPLYIENQREIGSRYLISVVDDSDAEDEINESNNISFTQLDLFAADFMFADVFTENNFVAGQTASVKYTVENTGAGDAYTVSSIHWYLSKDSLADNADLYLANNTVQTLQSNEHFTFTQNIDVPLYIALSDWFVIGAINCDSAVSEENYQNNTVRKGIRVIAPDIAGEIHSLSSSIASASETITIDFSVANNGPAPIIKSVKTDIYISNDTIFDYGDAFIASYYTSSSMGNGDNFQFNETIKLPDDINYGEHNILVVTDAGYDILEMNEKDNTAFSGITIAAPDLICTAGINTNSVVAGDALTIVTNIQNIMPGNSGMPVKINFYLSKDLYGKDYELFSDVIDPLAGHSGSSTTFTLNIPEYLCSGTYSIHIAIDPDNTIAEYRENNNALSLPVYVRASLPDYTVRSLSVAPPLLDKGQQFDVYCEINNKGESTFNSNSVSFFVSENETYDNSDYLIGIEYIDSLKSGHIYGFKKNLRVPLDITGGGKYILAVADIANTEPEINEDNNAHEAKIQVKPSFPDLYFTEFAVYPVFNQDDIQLNISYQTKNQGIENCPPAEIVCYLSNDKMLDINDKQLTEDISGNLSPGQRFSNTQWADIDEFRLKEKFYIIIAADPGNKNKETNELNNFSVQEVNLYNYKSDISLVDFAVDSETVSQGGYVNFDMAVENSSIVNAENIGAAYYLTKYDFVFSDDTPVSTHYYGNLNAGQQISFKDSILIPSTYSPGDWFIIAKPLADNMLAGFANKNKMQSVVISQDYPDIEPAISTSNPVSVAAGGVGTFSYDVKNLSGVNTQSFHVKTYLAVDEILSSTDVLLDNTYFAQLAEFDSLNIDLTVFIPFSIPEGQYYLIISADPNNEITESDETNNIVMQQVDIVSKPDLHVIHVALEQETIVAGENTEASCEVMNKGKLLADNTRLGYYLSDDNMLSDNDILIDDDAVGDLLPDESSLEDENLNIPVETSPGKYYIIFAADAESVCDEIYEQNNVAYQQITVLSPLPDLQPVSATIDRTDIAAGGFLEVSCELSNTGNSRSGESHISWYLSTDQLHSPDDALLGTEFIDRINTDNTRVVDQTVQVPTNTSIGEYYILFVVDALNEVDEMNEGNNVLYLPVNILANLPDLIVENRSDPLLVVPHDEDIRVRCSVKNAGGDIAGQSVLGYYISLDSMLDGNDLFLGTDNIGTLEILESSNENLNLTMPASQPLGLQYVLFAADIETLVAEANETNNVTPVAVIVPGPEPDVAIMNPEVDNSEILSGDNIRLSCDVMNLGGSRLPQGSSLAYYFSADSVLDESDILIDERNTVKLNVGETQNRSVNYTAPTDVEPGTWYIIFYCDADEEIIESAENNNLAHVKIVLLDSKPDLKIEGLIVSPQSGLPGDRVNVDCNVHNTGLGTCTASSLGFYLSNDEIFDPTDVLLDDMNVKTLQTQEFSNRSKNIDVPDPFEPGMYYIFAVADNDNEHVETNESNNATMASFEVLAYLPDLIVSNLEPLPSTVKENNMFALNYTIENTGVLPAGECQMQVYLSDEISTISQTAIAFEAETISPLAPGVHFTGSAIISLPPEVVAGQYYLFAKIDTENTVEEGKEENNTASQPLTVVSILPNLTISDIALSSETVEAGSALIATTCISNTGMGESGAADLSYFMHTEETVPSGAIAALQTSVNSLSPGESICVNHAIPINNRIAQGQWHITGLVDDCNDIFEAIETDNEFTTSVQIINSNDAPDILAHYELAAWEDTPFEISLQTLRVLDPDNDYPDDFTLTAFAGENYSVADNIVTPGQDYVGYIQVPVSVNDSEDESNVYLMIVNVRNVNDLPVITGQETLTMTEESALTITKQDLIVEDIDNAYPVQHHFIVNPGENYVVKDATIFPVKDFYGELIVPAIVHDGVDASLPYNLLVSVQNVNDLPVIIGQQALTAEEESTLSVTLNDLIVEDVDNTYPDDFIMTILASENYTVANGVIALEKDFTGFLPVPVYVNDGLSSSDIYNVEVFVENINDKPVIVSQNAIHTNVGENIELQLSSFNITDVDNELDELSLTIFAGDHYTYIGATLIPAPGFSGELTVPVAVSDNEDISDVFECRVSVFTENLFVWTGESSAMWSDTGNWKFEGEDATVTPGGNNDVLVPEVTSNYPSIDGQFAVQNLTLLTNAELTISNGSLLEVNGDVWLNQDAVFTVKDDILNNSGQLFIFGDIFSNNANCIFERWLRKWQYHVVSSPIVTPVQPLVSGVTPRHNYYWDESIRTWVQNRYNPTLSNEKGYDIYYNSDQYAIFRGNNFVNTNPHQMMVQNTGSEHVDKGLNLIGNPYSFNVNADEFLQHNDTIIEGSMWIWDEKDYAFTSYSSKNYLIYNTYMGSLSSQVSNRVFNGVIAPTQGFFVRKIYEGSSSIEFNKNMRESTDATFFKSINQKIPDSKFKVSFNSNNQYGEILIGTRTDATSGYDSKYDAVILPFGTSIFYSFINNSENKYGIQGIPAIMEDETSIVKIGVSPDTSGIYNFTIVESFNMENIDVYIEDLVLDSITKISDIRYSVQLDAGSHDERFRLLFSSNNSLSDQGDKQVKQIIENERTIFSHVFSNDNNIYIHINMTSIGIYAEVYSILGQKLIQQQIVSDYTKIPVHNGKGIYLVKLFSREGIIKTAKVYVEE